MRVSTDVRANIRDRGISLPWVASVLPKTTTRSLLLDGCSPGGVEARTVVELRQARVAAFEKRILCD